MSKFIGLIITAAAFIVAVVLVLRRRKLEACRPGSHLAARFWVLVTLFVGLLGGVPGAHASADKTPSSTAAIDRSALAARPEWQKIKKDWLAVEALSGFGWDDMTGRVDVSKKTCGQSIQALVSAGLVDKDAAEVFCRIQADRVYHKLRLTAATCYDPTMLGAKVQSHREDFENRLKALAKTASGATLQPAVIEKIRQTIARQMEFSLRVDDHWKAMPKNGPWDDYRKQEQALMAWFAKDDYKTIDLKADLPVRPAVAQALELVQLIYRD